jgi:hypothetical protein
MLAEYLSTELFMGIIHDLRALELQEQSCGNQFRVVEVIDLCFLA